MITVVSGKKGLVALYKDNNLVFTGGKEDRANGSLELAIKQRMDSEDEKVVEKDGDFDRVLAIPRQLEVKSEKKEPKAK